MRSTNRQSVVRGGERRQMASVALRRGFSLMELLVVIAITSVLLVILFIPLTRSLELNRRAVARIAGQEAVRRAMQDVTSDLRNAMEVYEPRPIAIWGYNAWEVYGPRHRPVQAAVPERYELRNGMVVFRLPRQRYYNTVRNRYVTPEDIDLVVPPPRPSDDMISLATDPRFSGEPVELRPVQPLTPSDRLTAYFIGLKNPNRITSQGLPAYENMALFGRGQVTPFITTLNTYALYRVEFDPNELPFTNWQSPDFFYDQTPITYAGQTKPRSLWWRDASNTVMDSELSDVVRWVETAGGKRIPHAMVTFTPASSIEEVAQPNTEAGRYLVDGTTSPADIPPTEYTTPSGNWTGVKPFAAAYGKLLPIPATLAIGPSAVGGVLAGPHVTVFDPSEPNPALRVKFDSLGANRERLLTFDPESGRIIVSFERQDFSQPVPAPNEQARLLRQHYSATIDTVNFRADLNQDLQSDPNGMPASFGQARSIAALAPTTVITPGSEAVLLYDNGGTANNTSDDTTRPMTRAGWSGLPGGLNRIVAQADLDPDEYSIDYSTGEITLADRNPALWAPVGPGGQVQLLVRYQFQTNRPSDVVRVTYSSRELLSVNLGIVQYTRGNQEVLPFEVSQRVVVGNLKR